jgi:glycine cleavage system H protein
MDFLPTKGIEYLLAISYLLLLAPFWWFAVRGSKGPELAAAGARRAARGQGWFRVPAGFHFHRGHTWAQPDEGGLLRVGMDDFARLFLGRPQALALPGVGEQLQQGERGWSVNVDGHDVPLLSPVQGEVEEVNAAVVANPRLMQADPYGRGWLLKVRASQPAAGLKNLLPATLARSWMDETSRRLGTMMSPELGLVLQDGGELVSGIARELAGDEWPDLAAEMLLTASDEG